jgi:nuclear pore complex protein Nup98-Nup96
LFGSGGTSNSTFGGFGSTNNNNNTTTSAFGAANNNTSIFGQNKTTGFGSNTGSTPALFGGGSTGGGFGTTNNTSGGFPSSTTGGFGATNSANNGTASTPFQAFSEKDSAGQQQYQTITFQQPYANFSLEELRVVDYAQGRKFGNNNGQAGAFGQSTGFGGFGSNNNTTSGFGANNTNTGGLFNNQNNNTSTGFGSNNTSGFGSNNNTTGGLFGQNKPASGPFGSTTNTTQSGTTNGAFGATSTTSNPFGSTNTNTNNAFGSTNTGGLFGQNNNTTQNKPAFGAFGGSNTTPATNAFTNNTGGLFGQNQTSSTPAFGANTSTNNTTGTLFGNTSTSNTTGGLFGQNQQQNQSQPANTLFGGGLGQNNQNQPKTGLFGSTTANTGTGLFANTSNVTNSTGGLFGQNLNQNKPSLFGNSTNTTAPGGIFGSSTANTSNTGGLFGGLGGQNNNQQTSSTGLFGNSTNQQKPSLFGGSATTNTNSGGGLFSSLNQNNNNAAPQGGSLWGGNQSQPQSTQQPMNNSLFGASGNLNTSLNTNPYGNDPLFAGLSTPLQSPGPLATPLSTGQKNKKNAILPQHKLNPSASTRLLTPQGKRGGGYGFTYSTYGTPGSNQPSPLGGSLFGTGSLSRHLGKSVSSSNLRNTYSADTSILAPGAFSMTARPLGNGSLKKLNLNRNLNQRPTLFDEPGQKRVSFAAASSDVPPNGSATNGESSSNNALIIHPNAENGSPPAANGNSREQAPEMEQVNGGVVATESQPPRPRTSASLNIQNGQTIDPTPGGYFSEPSLDTLKKMSPNELKSVPKFVVGREKIGRIEFNYGKPIDLSNTPLDSILENIVVLEHRTATVYGEKCTVTKPLLGSGLNYPSRIVLGNSWPRGANRASKQVSKHVERLKRVPGTEFEKYDTESGEWVFGVPHFSSYGFDYDLPGDDESSELSPVPETPAQFGSSQMTSTPQDSIPSATQSSPDDTFDFKRGMSRRSNVPGQYDEDAAYEESDEEMQENQNESFLGDRSVGSLDGHDDYTETSGYDSVEDQDMADSVSGSIRTTEQDAAKQFNPFKDSAKPKSILKGSQLFRPALGTPSKAAIFDDDWASALQRTISPRKQDRQALREGQGDALRERGNHTNTFAQSLGVRNTKSNMSRMDLYESLFGQPPAQQESTPKRVGQGIQV